MPRLSFLPIIFLHLVCTLLDWYVFQGVKAMSREMEPDSQSIIYTLFWVISISVLWTFIFNFYRAFPSRKFTLLFNTVFNTFLTIFVSKVVFAALLFIEDLYRMMMSAIITYPERSSVFSFIALIISVIPLIAFAFGVTKGKYHYKVRRVKLFLDDLPSNFEGFTITQISDVHSGSFDNPEGVAKGIKLINEQNSDLFVFTGDLVNNKADEIEPWIELFSQISAPAGKFSILGNHDYGDYIHWDSPEEKIKNLQNLKGNHKRLGFKLLLDEHVLIEREGQQIGVLGVENWGVGFGKRGNLNKALNGLNPTLIKILLSHDPSHWDAEVIKRPEHIHLTLSGHTHGMQFGIELFGFKWSPVKYRYPNWAGLVKENNRYLYVNRGFGFLGFAGRVGIWPEITVIELRKAN